MKKILIYFNDGDLAPTGGPNGYLYNLREGFSQLGNNNVVIDFLPGGSKGVAFDSGFLSNIFNKKFSAFLKRMKRIWGCIKVSSGRKHYAGIDLQQYDAIHFHSTYSMYKTRDSLTNYKGKILLSSHTPTKPSIEAYDNISEYGKYEMKQIEKVFEKADDYAINRADYIIFPCPEAEEPYYNHWPNYESIHSTLIKKYRYILTGTQEKKAELTKEKFREKYNIPQDAFVVVYVGRHNEIKGYDCLKLIGEKILHNQDIYFLVAGKEEPLTGLVDPRWIEIGWTNDPHSLINAADVFVLPNRETYFDLVMLEVLSLGQIVVAAKNGGNRHFEIYDNSGIYLYESIDQAINLIYKIKDLNSTEKNALRESNKWLFKNVFTTEIFAKNYVSLLENILEEKDEQNG